MFAFYGLAMYQAQVLEHEIVNLLTVVRMSRRDITSADDFDAAMNSRFKDRLSELVRRVKQHVNDDGVSAELSRAVEVRNDLAHNFWRRNADNFMTRRGQLDMIQDLQERTSTFIDLDAELTKVTMRFGADMNITPERVQQQLETLRSRCRSPAEALACRAEPGAAWATWPSTPAPDRVS
ncbi:hypothetical protein [Kineococcus sp. SYSU DK006]|uniref:hypothetical protein n=1 Tax=Kineococcus sp. SYSU DK006 TaxID=3383127 RepID=UPI003D7C8305